MVALSAESLALTETVHLIITALIGFACIYLGYRLFAQIPVKTTNDGHFKMPSFGEVKLKVAPGVFFAVLGAAIVIFGLARSMDVKTDTYQYRRTFPQG